ncbi:MAG: NosR/NirI family protein [Gammaproteobacteria bacterium]|nr:NosR/NirI family protein [Gammaproteobacteria bacterium]MBU2478172.1 NosR/NirI family protein [Gammaproteobacteria bacterium]
MRRACLPSVALINLLRWIFVLSALLGSFAPAAADDADNKRLYPLVHEFFPQADRFGPFDGEPRAAPVIAQNVEIGYIYLTDDILPIPAYSGKPISTLVAVNLDGTIVGVRIVHHEEPILLAGVTEKQLAAYVEQYRGINANERIKVGGSERDGYATVDSITGATITVMVINQTITKTLSRVAKSRGLFDGRPAQQVLPFAEDSLSIWQLVWKERQFRIGVLVVALVFLTLVLLFQDWLVQHPRLLVWVRDGYLVFTVIFIGWYALAQLSVINVLTFVHALMQDFRWETFLIDPLMFILWGFVAFTLLLWGRGVYCGWLCPFGALQELINQLARKFNVRQWEFPEVVHERLWALKYVVLLLLFGLSLQSLSLAETYAEVEPFKTAMTLRFQREWGYLVYALVLLGISVVNRKFYCKYICPLGAALAIPARQRLFDWLRRRKECGKPCQICANECEVRAINATGEINGNECHYCLDCQVTYWNDHKCPPMAQRRKRRQKGARARELAEEMVMSFRAMDSTDETDAKESDSPAS